MVTYAGVCREWSMKPNKLRRHNWILSHTHLKLKTVDVSNKNPQ